MEYNQFERTGTISLEISTTENPYVKVTCSKSTFQRTDNKSKKISETMHTDEYALQKVSVDELFQIRLSRKPCLIYKKGSNLYVAFIDKYFRLPKSLTHCCNNCNNVANKNICKKVTDSPYKSLLKKHFSLNASIKHSSRIESYNFIKEGIELYNLDGGHDYIHVLKCANYIPEENRKFSPKETAKQMRKLKDCCLNGFDKMPPIRGRKSHCPHE